MTRFKDPIAPKKREGNKDIWSFKAPTYDQQRAGNIYAGDNYGSGFNQPVGKFSASGVDSGPVPQNSFKYPAHVEIDGEK